MVSKLKNAAIAAALISGAAWFAAPARADNFPPTEGTVYSTISPATDGCPELNWQVRVGPNSSLAGMVAQAYATFDTGVKAGVTSSTLTFAGNDSALMTSVFVTSQGSF